MLQNAAKNIQKLRGNVNIGFDSFKIKRNFNEGEKSGNGRNIVMMTTQNTEGIDGPQLSMVTLDDGYQSNNAKGKNKKREGAKIITMGDLYPNQ